MQRFKNILAVYGNEVGCEDVLSQAFSLAQSNSAQLTVIEVVPSTGVKPAIVSERRKRLKRIALDSHYMGIADVQVIVRVGSPFEKIIQQVLHNDHDLVIAAPGEEAGLGSLYFSSTATQLMRKCPCPVWIIEPDLPVNSSKILACIDPKEEVAEKNPLDIKILDLSTSLARMKNADLHIVHGWDIKGKDNQTLHSEIPYQTRQRILRDHKNAHLVRVNALLERYDLDKHDYELHLPRTREPQGAICELVRSLGIQQIVMGTTSRSGISGLLIGNAAEFILSQVECGVFAVKPDNFRSPIILEEELRMVGT